MLTQARHPLMPDDSMAELLRRHLRGTLPEDLWKEVVQGFCKPKVLPLPWSPFLRKEKKHLRFSAIITEAF